LKEGLILFAHGSRDPEWARPFEAIAATLAKDGFVVRTAFLELMRPTLAEALAELVALKVGAVRIVPVFLGAGGHVKQDLPRLVMEANPPLKVTIDPPIGEQDAVVRAIAAAIAKRGGRASP
jgi:sirohydrochlorin cobaltochelatase